MRRITTTFPSDDEWEEIDKRARMEMWIRVQTARLAVFLAAALLVFFLLLWVRNLGERHYDAWAETCRSHLRKEGGR